MHPLLGSFLIRASVRRAIPAGCIEWKFQTFKVFRKPRLFGGKIDQQFEVTNKNVVRWYGEGVNSRD
jgi:hypothetical protein